MNLAIEMIVSIFLLIILFFCSAFYFIRSMHMFQLNSYKAAGQFKWFGHNRKWILLSSIAPLISTVALIILFNAEPVMIHRTAEEGYVPCGCDDINNPLTWGEINVHEYYSQPYSAQTLGGIALLLIASTLILGRRKVKVKKRLVFTPRVIRMCISAGIFYAALFIGFYFLVAFFIEQYNDSVIWLVGLAPLFIPFSLLLPIIANIINSPIEKLNNLRYINDAKRIIDNHKNLITIGITGSYGKTSTKFFLHKLLSVKYNTLMTPESFNTTLGVVKTIRNDLKATHEIFICEMGLKWLGDIKEICEIVKPRHSILTSIGPQHLETMKTLDNIINEKFEIVNAINTDDGMVFLNYDNEHIASRKVEKNIVRYGLTAGNKDYCASDISVSEKGTAFTVNGVRFETRLLGAHNVQNITGAIACANRLGIELKDLVLPVKRLEPVPHRLQIINKGTDIIIDDAFNSNPVGASSALDVLKAFNGLRILVTPGMVELGEKEFELNKSFGFHAGECCDYAVLIGEKQAVPIKAGLLENNFPDEKIHVFKTLNEGLEFVYKIDSEQKVILLENDLPDNY